jgi:hypothetical protein
MQKNNIAYDLSITVDETPEIIEQKQEVDDETPVIPEIIEQKQEVVDETSITLEVVDETLITPKVILETPITLEVVDETSTTPEVVNTDIEINNNETKIILIDIKKEYKKNKKNIDKKYKCILI